MGVAHHTHFLVWFELGRTELMRALGCTYGELEDRRAVYFPVIEAGARYREPARYDEVVNVDTVLGSVSGARVRFEYTVSRQTDGTVLATGFTEHASVGESGRPTRIPADLGRRLRGEGLENDNR
jgi:acyl-CoA thioester hydrolase